MGIAHGTLHITMTEIVLSNGQACSKFILKGSESMATAVVTDMLINTSCFYPFLKVAKTEHAHPLGLVLIHPL